MEWTEARRQVEQAVRGSDGAVQVWVRAQPGAKRPGLLGLQGDRLRVAVAAPPVDGKANDALIRWLAEVLDVSRRQVTLGAGPGSRDKRLDVDASKLHVIEALAKLLAQGE